MLSVIERVAQVISDYTEIKPITPETDILTDLGLDSLDLIEVAMDLEKEFDLKIEDDDWSACHKVKEIADLILVELKKAGREC